MWEGPLCPDSQEGTSRGAKAAPTLAQAAFLSFPEKFRRAVDLGRQTLVNGTIERGALE